MADEPVLDALDLALLAALRKSPRAGILELSRMIRVARATVQSRLDRMERAGVITGYGPEVDVAAAGYPVQAFVTLEITQGALEQLHSDLSSIPGVLEAYAITGTGDVICRIAAASNAELQQTLLQLNGSAWVARSTSAVLLSTVIAPRATPLLASRPRPSATRAPAFRAEAAGAGGSGDFEAAGGSGAAPGSGARAPGASGPSARHSAAGPAR